jgi:hypothetical protein
MLNPIQRRRGLSARMDAQEVEDEAAQGQAAPRAVDVEELLDDPELERLHADRLAAMKEAAERRAKLEQQGHGAYTEIGEGEFLEAATKTDRLVAHFFHRQVRSAAQAGGSVSGLGAACRQSQCICSHWRRHGRRWLGACGES